MDSIKNGMSSINAVSPSFDVNLSSTFLARYGVQNMTINFDWFAPYRDFVLRIESAFLYVAFGFKQYFNIKNLLNASNSAVGAVSSVGGGSLV